MLLTSTAFQNSGAIPRKYTCQGENLPPPLHVFDIPTNAQTLVLIVEDPDVPPSVRSDRMWDHWILFNIPAREGSIGATGTPGKNTSGSNTYEGPCPPDREHRYFFKLYALDCALSLSPGATKQQVQQAMRGHILAETTLIGRYNKS